MAVFGRTSLLPGNGNTLKNNIIADIFTIPDEGEPESMSIRIDGAAWTAGDKVRCAIYDAAGNFIVQTEERSDGGADLSWQIFNFAAGTRLTIGNDYILAATSDDNVFIGNDDAPGGNVAWATAQIYGTWKDPLGAKDSLHPPGIYCTYTIIPPPTLTGATGGGRKVRHDFKKFPELTNKQMETMYYDSPHKQITQSFRAEVVKVIDGDTIRVQWTQRDFDFPVRFLDINAPEMNEPGGKELQQWLEGELLGKQVDILVSQNRVDKWGRLLGRIVYKGIDIGDEMLRSKRVTSFTAREEGKIPDINKILNLKKWY